MPETETLLITASRKGGNTTKEKYGIEHFSRIGKLGGQVRRNRKNKASMKRPITCLHLRKNGGSCGMPAMKGTNLCYSHTPRTTTGTPSSKGGDKTHSHGTSLQKPTGRKIYKSGIPEGILNQILKQAGCVIIVLNNSEPLSTGE